MSTRRLAESVEGLNSSLALAAGNFWPKKGQPITAVKELSDWPKLLNHITVVSKRMLTCLIITDHEFHFSFYAQAILKQDKH